LAGFPGVSVVGVDMDERVLAVCEEHRQRRGVSNVEFRRGDLRKDVGLGQYRLIVCVDMLDDIPDDVAALGRFFEATTAGGELVLHVPLKGSPVLFNAIARFPYELSVRQYSASEIEAKVKLVGFSVVEKRMTFGVFGSIARELWYLAWRACPNQFFKIAIHPAVMALGWLDVLLPIRNGRGYLLVCRR
jgi:SAM-dependent methyltransferase